MGCLCVYLHTCPDPDASSPIKNSVKEPGMSTVCGLCDACSSVYVRKVGSLAAVWLLGGFGLAVPPCSQAGSSSTGGTLEAVEGSCLGWTGCLMCVDVLPTWKLPFNR